MSEPYEGPVPPDYPLRGEDEPDDRDPWPACPVCGRLMRRRGVTLAGTRPLACDLHGVRKPIWLRVDGDDAA